MPFPLLHLPADGFKQGGIVFLDPLVKDALVVVENKAGKFLRQLSGGSGL